jgi:hypothetical protein
VRNGALRPEFVDGSQFESATFQGQKLNPADDVGVDLGCALPTCRLVQLDTIRHVGERFDKFRRWGPWHPKNWSVNDTLKNFEAFTRFVLIASLAIGIWLLVVLWAADIGWQLRIFGFDPIPNFLRFSWLQPGWLRDHSYIPNILAGFTGFLVGAPIATVVLATFATEREQNVSLTRVNEMSELAWNNFLVTFRIFSTPERKESVTSRACAANEHHNKAYNYVVSFINLIFQDSIGDVKNETEVHTTGDAHRAIQNSYQPFANAVEPITNALGDHESIETQWSALIGAWQTLDQFIRLQRLEQKLDWFLPENPIVDAEIRKLLSLNPNPLVEFSDLHGFSANAPGAAITMVNTVNTVKNYGSWSEDELREKLAERKPGYFGYSFVAHYGTRATDASHFLQRLESCVSQVVAADWPVSARTPRKPKVNDI